MKLNELFGITESAAASEIEAAVKELGDKTNKYRALKTLSALKELQRTQEKLIDKLKNDAA
jgi:hypothetical protein